MRCSIINVRNTKEDIDKWSILPEYIKTSGSINTTINFIYADKNVRKKLNRSAFSLIREIGGLEYYRQRGGRESILIPESHPLFNFYLIANMIMYNDYAKNNIKDYNETVRILIRRYVIPLIKPRLKI